MSDLEKRISNLEEIIDSQREYINELKYWVKWVVGHVGGNDWKIPNDIDEYDFEIREDDDRN